MRLQHLLQELEQTAERKADLIERETGELIRQYRVETEILVDKKRKELEKEVVKHEEEIKIRELGKKEREQRIKLLKKKREYIDLAFELASKKLSALKGKKREELLKSLMKRADKINVATIIPVKKDRAFLKKYKLEKSIDGLGGFIAIDKTGTIRIDLRFETLLEEVRRHTTIEVARILFGD